MTQKGPSPYLSEMNQAGQAGEEMLNSGVQGIENPMATPLYGALYGAEESGLSNAYQKAAANTGARAHAAGFGYDQGETQGAQAELAAKEASAQGQLPGQVAGQVIPAEEDIAKLGLGEEQMGFGDVTTLEGQYYNQPPSFGTRLMQSLLSS